MEAQAHRTNVRLRELGKQGDEDVMATNYQGRQPDDLPLPAYPNTAAKKNVTVRRSRDRMSAEPNPQPKSPEELTNRLPKRRERDVRYSMESESDSRGATAISYRRQHGRELMAPEPSPGQTAGDPVHVNSDILPPTPWTSDEVASTLRQEKDESFDDSRDRFHSREFNSPERDTWECVPKIGPDRVIDRQQVPPHAVFEIGSDDEEGSEVGVNSLFLKRDIPPASADPATHETLSQLWELRQQASVNLVRALGMDDSDLFNILEEQMRRFNQRMHIIYQEYLDRTTAKSSRAAIGETNEALSSVSPRDRGFRADPLLVRGSAQNLAGQASPDLLDAPRATEVVSSSNQSPFSRPGKIGEASSSVSPRDRDFCVDPLLVRGSTQNLAGQASPDRLGAPRAMEVVSSDNTDPFPRITYDDKDTAFQFPKIVYDEKDEEIQIKLDYNGVQVVRRIKGRTTNRVIYHLAQQYLREVFALTVANLSDLILLVQRDSGNHRELPVNGIVADIPILDGDEIMVMLRRWGKTERTQRQPDSRFEEDQSDEDSTDSKDDRGGDDDGCWPSQTGMRRGNPKKDFNRDGTRRNGNKQGDYYPGEDYRLLNEARTPHPDVAAYQLAVTPEKGMQAMMIGEENTGSRSFDKIRQGF